MVLLVAFLADLSGGLTGDENLSWFRAVADFFRDPKSAFRGLVAARFAADPMARGGDGVAANHLARVVDQIEGLRRDVDTDSHEFKVKWLREFAMREGI